MLISPNPDEVHAAARQPENLDLNSLDQEILGSLQWAIKVDKGDFQPHDLIVFPNQIANLMDLKDWLEE